MGSRAGISAFLNRLQDESARNLQELDDTAEQCGDFLDGNEDDGDDSESPLLDSIFYDGGNEAVTTVTNFTIDELDPLWSLLNAMLKPRGNKDADESRQQEQKMR